MDKYFFSFSWSNDDGKTTSFGIGNMGIDFPKGSLMRTMEDVKFVEAKIMEIEQFTNVKLMSWQKFDT